MLIIRIKNKLELENLKTNINLNFITSNNIISPKFY